MRIVELREMAVPLHADIGNALVSFASHQVSLVAVVSDEVRNGRPLTGVAFNSIGRHSQSGILRERIFPRLVAATGESLQNPATDELDPALVAQCAMADEKPGGHGDRAAAVSAVELACWDLLAKAHDEPAYQTIATAFGRTPVASVPVYAAGGYYEVDKGLDELRHEIEGFLGDGYEAVKIKIGGVELPDDLKRVETAVDAAGAGERVAVDANGRFDLAHALQYAAGLEPYNLRWFEEPGDPLDYHLNSELAGAYTRPIATGENLFSVRDVTNLLRYGGMRPDRDIFQMDAGLSYGLTEYAAMIEQMESFGFDRTAAMPHGGHMLNLHIVVGLGLGGCEAYPGVFQPFGGYSRDCRIANGRIAPSDAAGFGLETKDDLRPLIEEIAA